MRTSVLLGGLVALLLCSSCGNEESSLSNMEKNWYVLEYDPHAGETDMLLYDIYTETGFPIFHNDTLGKQVRYDQGGNAYTYYHVFRPGYSFTATTGSNFRITFMEEEATLQKMAEALRDYVLKPYFQVEAPNFQGKYGPHGILLVDSLLKGKTLDTLYRDVSGVLVLGDKYVMSERINNKTVRYAFDELTEEQKKEWGWRLAMFELDRYLKNTWTDRYQAYQDVTKEPEDRNNNVDCYALGSSFNIKNYNMDVTTPRKYGELSFLKYDKYSVYMPKPVNDLSDFTRMIYEKTDAEIRAEHAGWEMVLRRYEMLVQLLKDCGLTHFIKENR